MPNLKLLIKTKEAIEILTYYVEIILVTKPLAKSGCITEGVQNHCTALKVAKRG